MGRPSSRGARIAHADRRVVHAVRLLAGALALALLPVSGILAPMPASALRAADYPSWDDVKAARQNQAAAQQLAAQLEASLIPLQQEAQRTQDEADAKGAIYGEAQVAYDDQSVVTQALLDQTAAAQAEADEAYAVAAQVIAEMSKGGSSTDLTPQLFTAPGTSDFLLDRLEIGRALGERYAGLYAKALELRNTANALAEQAEVAEELLEELRIAAQKAYDEARAAQEAAAAKLAQTEKDIAEVRARVDYLKGVSEETTAKFNEGVRAQWGEFAEGQISASGYTRPHPGYITSNFGGRYNPVNGAWHQHSGVDLAGGGCGAIIRAAHEGVVTFAGWSGNSGWGNYVAIDHGDGTGSGYAHIQNGGILVQIGQEVDPGQPIARVGSTGMSTGCHLHFMIRDRGNSRVIDPVPFMRDHGATLG
jgi:murein DD-endopeptidase MepM/ murein hydrolase activator NlpD